MTITPHNGEEWMRQVTRRLASIERHRHTNNPVSDTDGTVVGPGSTTDSGWHYVGTTGEPTLNPGLVPFDTGAIAWSSGRFRRDAAGCVFLDGLYLLGSLTVPPFIPVFTLPEGFRPSTRQLVSVCAAAGHGPSQIEILPTGAVNVISCGSGNNYLFLTGITFMAEDALNVEWTPLVLGGGWTDFDLYSGNPGKHGAPAYYVDSVGDVHFRGVVHGGSTSVNMFTLPPGTHATDNKFMAMGTSSSTTASSGLARWEFNPDGSVQIVGYSANGFNDWISMAGIVISNPTGVWNTITLASSWVRYDSAVGGWPPPQWSVNENGVAAMRGLAKNGTVSVPTNVSPNYTATAFAPVYTVATLVGAGANAAARLDLQPSARMDFVGFFNNGTNAWLWAGGRWFVGSK